MSKHERALEAAEAAYKARPSGSRIAMLDAIAAYLAVMREPGPGEVRVRACVATAQHGYWFVWGQNDIADELARKEATCDYNDPRVTWLEGNVLAWTPVPEATVEGEVTE